MAAQGVAQQREARRQADSGHKALNVGHQARHAGLRQRHFIHWQQRNDDAVVGGKLTYYVLPVAQGPKQAVQQQEHRALALVYKLIPLLMLAAQFHLVSRQFPAFWQ